jgi:hypothetical protein
LKTATVKSNGRKWTVDTQAEWMKKTGLTDTEYRNALLELRGNGILITERHKWKGVPTNFMAIDMPVFLALEASGKGPKPTRRKRKPQTRFVAATVAQDTNPTVARATNRSVAQDTNPTILLSLTVESNCCVSSLRFGTPLAQNDNQPEEVEQKNPEEVPLPAKKHCKIVETGDLGDQAMNVQDVKAKLEASISARMSEAKAPPKGGGNKISVLHADWRLLVSSADNIISPNMSGADIGCLKRILAVAPEGQARAVLAAVAQNWTEFTDRLVVQHGAYKMPKVPALWVVSKFADAAVTFWSQHKLEVAKAAAKTAAVKSVAPKGPQLDPEVLEAWTRQEFDALYLEHEGPRKPGDEAKYEQHWLSKSGVIRLRIKQAWQKDRLNYKGPRPEAKVA